MALRFVSQRIASRCEWNIGWGERSEPQQGRNARWNERRSPRHQKSGVGERPMLGFAALTPTYTIPTCTTVSSVHPSS